MSKPPAHSPWLPAKYEPEDAGAIRAWSQGKASEAQQQRAFQWVVETLCETGGMSFRPESVRDSDFAEGKRHVGNQILKLSKLILKQSERRN